MPSKLSKKPHSPTKKPKSSSLSVKKAVVVQTKPASIKEEKKKVQEVIIEDDHNMEVVDEVDTRASGEDSITVKQKKENAKKMIEMVKKFNAKLKSSMERK